MQHFNPPARPPARNCPPLIQLDGTDDKARNKRSTARRKDAAKREKARLALQKAQAKGKDPKKGKAKGGGGEGGDGEAAAELAELVAGREDGERLTGSTSRSACVVCGTTAGRASEVLLMDGATLRTATQLCLPNDLGARGHHARDAASLSQALEGGRGGLGGRPATDGGLGGSGAVAKRARGVGGTIALSKEVRAKSPLPFFSPPELERMQTDVTQKPVLWVDAGACRYAQQTSTAKK